MFGPKQCPYQGLTIFPKLFIISFQSLRRGNYMWQGYSLIRDKQTIEGHLKESTLEGNMNPNSVASVKVQQELMNANSVASVLV